MRRVNLTSDHQMVSKYQNETEDYMSENFVVECSTTFKDVNKRKNRFDGNKSTNIKKQMTESLSIGINKSIDSKNIGFKLLEKLGGYDGRSGLGKDGKGISEPIMIDVSIIESSKKTKKTGLGIVSELRNKAKMIKEYQDKLLNFKNDLLKDFQIRCKYNDEYKRIKKSLKSAKNIIFELDCKEGITENVLWPIIEVIDVNTDMETAKKEWNNNDALGIADDATEANLNESLESLANCLVYLRQNYQYCLYCGCKYEDIDDLNDNCPGISDEDH